MWYLNSPTTCTSRNLRHCRHLGQTLACHIHTAKPHTSAWRHTSSSGLKSATQPTQWVACNRNRSKLTNNLHTARNQPTCERNRKVKLDSIGPRCSNNGLHFYSKDTVAKTIPHTIIRCKRTQADPATADPSRRQIWIHVMTAAIPMIGFGFMDNVVMITAGELIDASIGVRFGLSTITAAGLGQCVSDVSGVAFGGVVDYLCGKLNLPKANLTPNQRRLTNVRYAGVFGSAVGVLMGCLLGMSCLLFLDTDKAEKMKKAKELRLIFISVMSEGHKLLACERSTLFLYDAKHKELYSQFAVKQKPFRVPASATIAGHAIEQKALINIDDAYEHPRFYSEMDKQTGFRTQSILSAPIYDMDGEPVGVIQMVNKLLPDGSIGRFTEDDERLLTMLASHIGIFLKHWGGCEVIEADVSPTETPDE